jgi:hypothetical protein
LQYTFAFSIVSWTLTFGLVGVSMRSPHFLRSRALKEWMLVAGFREYAGVQGLYKLEGLRNQVVSTP